MNEQAAFRKNFSASKTGKGHEHGPVKVLIADDDPGTRLLLRTKLEQAGYEVVSVKNGREAINRLSDTIAAAVVDLKMPDIDGMECLRYIRRQYPDMSPIMLTASENITNAVEAMRQGALDYVTKPFNSTQLVALVEKAVNAFFQSRRLREAEQNLEQARQYQLFVAAQIQQSLLLGHPPKDIDGLDIAHLAISSQEIDGDFIDFIRQGNDVLDVVVADVMGKGIMSAFMGAALKSTFLQVLNDAVMSFSFKKLPEPANIVDAAHKQMISQMERFETFITLCYGRFDLEKSRFVFVDCGHVRTIHYRHEEKSVNLLRGANMPLGFPESREFTQCCAGFSPGDLFLFYSDGVTEAKNNRGELFDEYRLVRYVEENALKTPEELASGIRQKVTDFTGTDIFSDDFTCVAVRITGADVKKPVRCFETLEIDSDLNKLKKLREFITRFCFFMPIPENKDKIAEIEIAAVEVVTNIIKHAYRLKTGGLIRITARAFDGHMELDFRDYGENFDPADVPTPIFDGSKDSGMGCYIIEQIVDEVSYFRDETNGNNCTRLKFMLSHAA